MHTLAAVVHVLGSWLTHRVAVFVVLLHTLPAAYGGPETALRDYVAADDPAYGFIPIGVMPQPGFTIHLLSVTSQTWRSPNEVDRTLWSHWMLVIVPDQVVTTTGGLVVLGDDNSETPPNFDEEEVAIVAQLALSTGSVVALVTNIPNQPLVFADAPFPQKEDALVAYTWKKAMDTGDWTWPAYLPMVKGVVRAMDAVQEYAPTVTGLPVRRFVAIGFSKRGAATWLTAAVDSRIVALAPGVVDALNMDRQMEHHYSAYGFYSSALHDFTDYEILRRLRSPEGQDLLTVVDPYSYRGALGQPKFLLNSPGDQFFLPDSGRFYLGDLLGETLTRYVPNTDHSLSSSAGPLDAFGSLVAWYQQVIFDAPRPQISSTLSNGVLTVTANPPAVTAQLWTAVNPTARDFRHETIGEVWTRSPVIDSGGGTYVATLQTPTTGYAAYFIELGYTNVGGLPQTYSTRVYVTPDTMPFDVVDPIDDPRDKGYWKRQVEVALGAPGSVEVDPETLAGYFPLPLFDDHVTDVNSAGDVFAGRGGTLDEARAQCLTTRLNIASDALGWYSPVALDERGARPLWEHYGQAHAAFLAGDHERAKDLCEAMNSVDPPALPAR